MIPCNSFGYRRLCEEVQNRELLSLDFLVQMISKAIGKSALRIFIISHKFQLSFIFSLIHGTQVKIRLTAAMVSKAIRAERRQTRVIKL